MGLIAIVMFVVVAFASPLHAGWSGPAAVVQLSWGDAATSVGLTIGDTVAYDSLPQLESERDGSFFIDDRVNSRIKVFTESGALLGNQPRHCRELRGYSTVAAWCVFFVAGQGRPYHAGAINLSTGAVVFKHNATQLPYGDSIVADGSIAWFDNRYLFDTDGTLIRETPERPLELGRVSARRQGGTYVYETEYVDRVFVWDQAPETLWVHPLRINDTTLMHAGRTARWTVTEEIPTLPGQKPRFRVAKTSPDFEMPMDTHECFDDLENITTGVTCHRRTSYGETPVIGPDGSVYTYKAVYPGNPGAGYSVLKWTWQE